MPEFKVEAPFQPTGDQPDAIDQLVEGIKKDYKYQTLLGVTGSGKTYTVAKVIEQVQKPTLVLAPNKTLAAQLYSEYKEFFPNNAVEYFVSYYDYYQPEVYIARTDTYVEKESMLNEEIEKLRLSTTRSLFERKDVLIVASVSCIYGLGSPEEYSEVVLTLKVGEERRRNKILRHVTEIQYERNDTNFIRGRFRVRGDVLEIFPAYEDVAVRIEFFGDEIERMTDIDPLTGEVLGKRQRLDIYPAKHWVTTRERLNNSMELIERELEERLAVLEAEGKLLEAARLKQRTNFDIEMLRETGFCSGVENYSRHLAGRAAGEQPWTLMDYLPEDYLLVVDESHVALPQVRGMFAGDRSRKQVLVDYGFRLPSALDTIERVEILRDLRLGVYDVVVGINLLREGLDLPEVSLVAILDADKEGFLRSEGSLIQMIGRAARHVEGSVIMYADTITKSMQRAIDETNRRRALQTTFNEHNHITPRGIKKDVKTLSERIKEMSGVAVEATDGKSVAVALAGIPKDEALRLIKDLESQMRAAAKQLEFEKAAQLRDQIIEIRRSMIE